MRRLADRLMSEHRASIEHECQSLINDLGLEHEDVPGVCERVFALGMLGLGRLRATWMLHERRYLPHRDFVVRLLADVLLCIAMIERLTGSRARFDEDGLVEFSDGNRVVELVVCSGNGWMRWAQMEASVAFRLERLAREGRRPALALVSGVVGGRVRLATPESIAGEADADDVTVGAQGLTIVTVDEFRERPDLARQVIG
jgi:hypothetical protein